MATLEEYVAVGVDWLLHSEQPEDAWMQHHGVTAPEVDHLRLRFVPSGFVGGFPVLVVDRAHWHYLEYGDGTADNPLTDEDMQRVESALALAGVTSEPIVERPSVHHRLVRSRRTLVPGARRRCASVSRRLPRPQRLRVLFPALAVAATFS